jgi:hypothetical protein
MIDLNLNIWLTKIEFRSFNCMVIPRRDDAMVFMFTKAKKNIISASGGKLESLQNHCLFLFPGFAEEDEKNKNTNNLDICGSSSSAG